MKTYIQISLLAMIIILGGAGVVFTAQAATLATMPVLYSQNGIAQNMSTNYLPANNYYVVAGLQNGGHQVEYAGNGTFYDSSAGMFGGSVYNPTGTAGVILNYVNWFNYSNMTSTMPAFYNGNNQEVNVSGYLPAGTYYIGGGPSAGGHQIQYYGNGVYYDPSTEMYGGSIYNSNGTAGFSLGHV